MNSKTTSFICAIVQHAQKNGASGTQILKRAEACGILPVLMHAVEERCILPDNMGMTENELSSELQSFKMKQTARNMLWQKTAGTVLPALKKQVIVLKGVPLGELLAGNALWRSTTDLDIWIPENDCDDAVNRLSQLGYRIAEAPRLWATNQVMLEHDVLVPVELHWALAPKPWRTPAFDEAFERSRQICFRGLEMRVLGESDLAVHLLLHAHQHYFAVKTLIDLMMSHDKVQCDISELKRYSIDNLNNMVQMLCRCFDGKTADTFVEECVRKLSGCWFRSVLWREHRGELVFGKENKVIAGLGVLLRAVSMGLLDGYCYPVESFWAVILLGPHRIGGLNHKFLYQFTQK